MKTITIELTDNQCEVKFKDITNFTDLLVALATFEGVVGGMMDADKATIRAAIDEIQEDLQAKMPEGSE